MNQDQAKATAIEKCPWGIPGVDQILEGGLPRGRTTIIRGEAGSGKTIFGIDFLCRGTLGGEPGVFVGFEEPIEQIRQNALSLGWDLPSLEADNRLALIETRLDPEMVVNGEFSLKGLLAGLAGKCREIGARRVCIDALEVALRLYKDPQQVRGELHRLNDWLREQALTVILSIRTAHRPTIFSFEDFFESMGDCVIVLDTRIVANITTRRLRVVKYRGSDYGRNEYPYCISGHGIFLDPISAVGLRHKPLGDFLASGVAELDRMLGGGFRAASCNLVAGEPGTGKTTLACTFAAAACQRGEGVLYIGFEESPDAVVGNAPGMGSELRAHLESGRLVFLTRFPEAMGVEEHFLSALEKIEAHASRYVVVDAISACERMGGKQAAFDYLMRLLNTCKERGITILFTNQIADAADRMEISGNGISSMVDTVLLLAYKHEPGETNRLLQVLKARGLAHTNQTREYRITDHGIEIADPYRGRGEVLTGTARQLQEEIDRTEKARLANEIAAKELELGHLRLVQRQMDAEITARDVLRELTPPATPKAQTEE